MKAILTENDVKNAVRSLETAGRKVTLAALHAALGNRGSITTLVKLKAAIEKENQEPETSEEAKEAFRLLWAAGLEAGQRINDGAIADLKETVSSLTAENEALDAQGLALQHKLDELQGQVTSLVHQLDQANTERRGQLDTITSLRDVIVHKQAELSKLENTLGDLTTDRDRLAQELDSCRKREATRETTETDAKRPPDTLDNLSIPASYAKKQERRPKAVKSS